MPWIWTWPPMSLITCKMMALSLKLPLSTNFNVPVIYISNFVFSSCQNMVKSFRVSDLQTLLASMGRSKSGLKQDLVGRALRLVQTEYSPELLKNVRQLYESRFPKTSGWLAARRPEGVPVAYSPLSSSPTATSQGADYLNGISKPIPTPAAEVKLVPLPFYQTLETLLPPTELSKCRVFDVSLSLCLNNSFWKKYYVLY